MPSIAPHVRQRLLCRSDLEGMSVEGERIAAWLWSGQLEVLGSIADEHGADDTVYAVNSEALRAELAQLLAAHGRTDLEFSGEAAKQLLHATAEVLDSVEPLESVEPVEPVQSAEPLESAEAVELNAEQAQPASPPADVPAVEDVLAEHVAEEQLDSAIDEITDAIGTLLEAHHCAPLELRDDSPHADREDTVALETENETQFDENVEVAVDADVDTSNLGEGDVLIELEADDEAQAVAETEDVPEANVEPELHEPAESALADEPEPTETIEAASEVDSTNDETAEVEAVTETIAPEEQSASVFEANLAEALDAALQEALTEQPHELAASPVAAASIAPVAPTPAHTAEPQPVEVHVQLDVQPLEAPLQQIQAALQKLADGQPSPTAFAPLADSIAASIRSLQETIRETAERAQQDDRIDRIHATLEDMTDALGALRHAESQRARATERRLQRAERRQRVDSPDDGRGAILVAGSVAIVGWIAAMWLHATDLRLALGALVAANFVSLFVLARRRSD
jgi:hypothetical protein